MAIINKLWAVVAHSILEDLFRVQEPLGILTRIDATRNVVGMDFKDFWMKNVYNYRIYMQCSYVSRLLI